MPQIINTNIMSLTAQRNLNSSQSAGNDAMTRLSSGLRINSAKDDAAGLAISTRFESQIGGLNVATRNAGDGVSLAQTAEGSLQSMSDSLSRLRELAVQSANATNSDVDREALNAEAQQIIDEVDQLSQQANFNGVKLLDGSFQDQQFQTGANVGETINVSIAEASINTLGAADTAGISSNIDKTGVGADDAANSSALVAGDLVINGIAVGASSGTDDTASTDLQAASSISKAAAINAVSDQTGVTATVDENTVEGTSIAGALTAANGAITINDVSFDIDYGATAAGEPVRNELNKIAETINAKADATGVSATVVTTDDGFRIDLTAEDGRNIALGDDGALGADTFGLAPSDAAGSELTYTGNVTLVSDDGSDITITSTTGDIDNAGFEEGTFSGNNGGVVGDASATSDGRAALVAGDLTINGVGVGQSFASDDTASTTDSDASAISIAAAINRVSDNTGVTAEAGVNTVYSGDIAAAGAGNMDINGVNIEIAVGTDVASQLTNTIDAINAVAGQTGVTAEALDGDSYKMVAVDGRNIDIANSAGEVGGITDDTNIAGVVLTSAGEFTLGSETGDIENLGLNVGTYGGSESGTLLKDVDISTVAGANAAITAVDNALADISSQQADLGAIQNRFDNTMSSNQLNSENLSAANSRIKDADFAAETAALSRASVLQQAGISILAQANAQPQQVLSLLG